MMAAGGFKKGATRCSSSVRVKAEWHRKSGSNCSTDTDCQRSGYFASSGVMTRPSWKTNSSGIVFCSKLRTRNVEETAPNCRVIAAITRIRGLRGFRIVVKNPKMFLRPVDQARGNMPTPTARMADPLSLGQVCLAAAQLLLRLLCCGDVRHGTHKFEVA